MNMHYKIAKTKKRSNRIIIDIGANKGFFTNYILQQNTTVKVLAFEPIDYIYENNLLELQSFYPNLVCINAAVGDKDGFSKLYGANVLNGQMASLFRFNPNSSLTVNLPGEKISGLNKNYKKVQVISPKSICKKFQIKKIDFLKIDTQGNDVKILKYFLNTCEIVNAVVEVNASDLGSESRYIDDRNSFTDLFEVISGSNLKIIKIQPNSADCEEYNVFLSKSKAEFSKFDTQFDILNCAIFSRYSQIIGIGEKQAENNYVLWRLFFKKILQGLTHPFQSIKSLLVKLVS